MKRFSSILFFLSIVALMIVTGFGCQQDNLLLEPESNSQLKATLEKVTFSDQSITSFEPNYNEEQAMSLVGGLAKEIYPFRVGQRMKLVDRKLEITYPNNKKEAEGKLTLNFEGVLLIIGFSQPQTEGSQTPPDVTLEKPFKTTIVRIIKYVKFQETGDDTKDWKIAGVSLPVGGTENPSFKIVKVVVKAEGKNPITIDNPANIFFGMDGLSNNGQPGEMGNGNGMGMGRGMGNGMGRGIGNGATNQMKDMMVFGKRAPVTISVFVESTAAKDEFITVTYGAMANGMFRVKEQFSKIETSGNVKKFEKTILTNMNSGFMHAVINVLNNGAVYDDKESVQEVSWGIPYAIK